MIDPKIVMIDECHMQLIIGMLASVKPLNILELGIGSGELSKRIAETITTYNLDARHAIVDSWLDWGGLPQWNLVPKNSTCYTAFEEDFVKSSRADRFDFLVSDADHESSPTRFAELCHVVADNGVMFFHDTNSPLTYPNLANIINLAKAEGKPYYHFVKNSLLTERCERGLLLVINKKDKQCY